MMAVRTFIYGSEKWALKERRLKSVESAEMIFLRSIKDCTRLDTTSNHCIRSELGLHKLSEKIEVNETNLLQNGSYILLICNLEYKPIKFKGLENT
jgi:hypothetical protein